MSDIKKQSILGIKWTALESFSIQGVHFILGILIARLLTPADYGTIGMLGIFMAISQTFIDSGITNALIRKLDRTNKDLSTAFYYNLIVSVVCAVTIFFASPLIADFFNNPILSPIAKLSSLNLIIGAFGMIQSTQLTIALNFKKLAKINFTVATTSGLICLGLAFAGWGVWALVWQSILSNLLRQILLWSSCAWRPIICFSRESFKHLFGYGNKLMASSLLHTIYLQMTTIVIGKFYTPASLGNYSRGTQMATMPVDIITDTLGKVTFPILSTIQNDDKRLRRVYRHYISLVMMFVVFAGLLLVVIAKPLILTLLTQKWHSAIIFLQIFMFAVIFDPICKLNLNLLQVKGRSDLFLRLEIIKKVIALIILFSAIPFGVIAICISKVIYGQIAVILNTYYTGKYFKLGYWQQLMDFLPYFGYTIVALIPSFLMVWLCPYNILNLIVCVPVSTGLYLSILRMRKDAVFMDYAYPYFLNLKHKIRKK